ncbi:beta-propeller fold lactonase family protein [Actinoplanes sp. NPDC049802]|uniref:beta-propeller fold lactonase family protein n=1 Tax=Actinoplanes sp. NPDC049802 TaxID=3154742 RepID=UPI0033C7B394
MLRRFSVPSADVPAFADVLGEPALGGFDVAYLRDPGAREAYSRIKSIFDGREQDDCVLIYFRGVMLTGPGGSLYLAAADTVMGRPADTAIDVAQMAALMQRSRAGQAVVLLDGRTGSPVDAGHHFRATRSAEWQSRVVIAATARLEPPTFAGLIADGVTSGAADRDRDGWIGIGELHDHLRERDPSVRQWVFGSGRQPYLARVRRQGSDQMAQIAQLAVAAAGDDLSRAVEARESLRRLSTGEGRVAAAASAALRRTSVRLAEPVVDFGRVAPGTRRLAVEVAVQGPPLTAASAVSSSVDGLHARLEGNVLRVSWFPTVGRLDGAITLDGPAGSAHLAVTGEVAEDFDVATGGWVPRGNGTPQALPGGGSHVPPPPGAPTSGAGPHGVPSAPPAPEESYTPAVGSSPTGAFVPSSDAGPSGPPASGGPGHSTAAWETAWAAGAQPWPGETPTPAEAWPGETAWPGEEAARDQSGPWPGRPAGGHTTPAPPGGASVSGSPAWSPTSGPPARSSQQAAGNAPTPPGTTPAAGNATARPGAAPADIRPSGVSPWVPTAQAPTPAPGDERTAGASPWVPTEGTGAEERSDSTAEPRTTARTSPWAPTSGPPSPGRSTASPAGYPAVPAAWGGTGDPSSAGQGRGGSVTSPVPNEPSGAGPAEARTKPPATASAPDSDAVAGVEPSSTAPETGPPGIPDQPLVAPRATVRGSFPAELPAVSGKPADVPATVPGGLPAESDETGMAGGSPTSVDGTAAEHEPHPADSGAGGSAPGPENISPSVQPSAEPVLVAGEVSDAVHGKVEADTAGGAPEPNSPDADRSGVPERDAAAGGQRSGSATSTAESGPALTRRPAALDGGGWPVPGGSWGSRPSDPDGLWPSAGRKPGETPAGAIAAAGGRDTTDSRTGAAEADPVTEPAPTAGHVPGPVPGAAANGLDQALDDDAEAHDSGLASAGDRGPVEAGPAGPARPSGNGVSIPAQRQPADETGPRLVSSAQRPPTAAEQGVLTEPGTGVAAAAEHGGPAMPGTGATPDSRRGGPAETGTGIAAAAAEHSGRPGSWPGTETGAAARPWAASPIGPDANTPAGIASGPETTAPAPHPAGPDANPPARQSDGSWPNASGGTGTATPAWPDERSTPAPWPSATGPAVGGAAASSGLGDSAGGGTPGADTAAGSGWPTSPAGSWPTSPAIPWPAADQWAQAQPGADQWAQARPAADQWAQSQPGADPWAQAHPGAAQAPGTPYPGDQGPAAHSTGYGQPAGPGTTGYGRPGAAGYGQRGARVQYEGPGAAGYDVPAGVGYPGGDGPGSGGGAYPENGGEPPRRRLALVAGVLVVLLLLAGGTYAGVRFVLTGDEPEAAPRTPAPTQQASQQPGAVPTEPAGTQQPAAPASLAKPVVVEQIKLGREPEGVAVSPDNRTIYVADQSSTDVHFVDVRSKQISVVKVPNTPRFLALSADGSRLYVSLFENNFTGNGLAVIDTAKKSLVKTIRTGPRPFEPAVAPDGRIWLPIHNGARVEIYDDESLTEAARISVPPNPHWVVFTPDGRTAFTANHESSQISVVNVADQLVRKNFKVGKSPHALAVTPDGRQLVATNYDLDTVEVYDTGDQRLLHKIKVGREPQAVMVSGDGQHAYVVNEGSDNLSVIDLPSGRVVSTVGVGDSPRVNAVSPDGKRLYVTDGRGKTVTVLRTSAE